MYVRKKANISGVISVQVIDKSQGKYSVIKTIGSSADLDTVNQLLLEAKQWVKVHQGVQDMFEVADQHQEERESFNYFFSNIENVLQNGTRLILEKVFKSIGFGRLNDNILEQLVVARLSQPMSKLATVSYLKDHFDEDIHYQQIYRYMDKLANTKQQEVQQISVDHTRRILGGRIGLMFYDVTTLYFEADESDELRERGFSKDGKHAQPQVVLGLLVSDGGYPLSYSIFNGAQFEGRTMLPIVDAFVAQFKLKDFVVVADSGLMNKKNIKLLEDAKYKYILGARIKNGPVCLQNWILSLDKTESVFYDKKLEKSRLIIGYSAKRAKKDKYNREKGIKRLKAAFKTGKVTKENINKRGYNKFLEIADDVTIKISDAKIQEDEKWDGLKGYLTNTDLPAQQVYEQYNGLWVVERAFRIAKGTIELRPMFHFSPKRIEAHVTICFVAYKVYKELERILILKKIKLSVDKVIEIARTITTITARMPKSGETVTKIMLLTPKQKAISSLIYDDLESY
ncbi:Transposase [Arachidicoccus rhizosphaerae]|uniref:Transposase n=1 Tax=Arachidicoccus rhizosphaerae TaxID=551991 RepID=A0A1H4D769_9BACT|nr:Transposase [Arachidicoccus rhizosphaerae]